MINLNYGYVCDEDCLCVCEKCEHDMCCNAKPFCAKHPVAYVLVDEREGSYYCAGCRLAAMKAGFVEKTKFPGS